MALLSPNFARWLKAQHDGGFSDLAARAAGEEWLRVQSLEEAWLLIEGDAALSAVDRDRLKAQAALAFVRFERDRRPRGGFLGVTAFGLGVFLFMASILAILAVAIFEPIVFRPAVDAQGAIPPLLTRLSNIETARGLITFVFTVGVIALALIIVTANVTSSDEEGARFERSKEILTSMIAILGTILGFYFGKADSGPRAEPPGDSQAQVTTPPAAAAETPTVSE